MKGPNGTIISDYFNKKGAIDQQVYSEGTKLKQGQVEKVHFTDDSTNRSKQFVEYDVSVRDAFGGQTVYKNVTKMSMLSGGTNDFEETILEPNAHAFTGNLDVSNPFQNKNGSRVVLAFFEKSLDRPFIVGTLQHNRRVGGTRSAGIVRVGEFRGLDYLVDKDGAFTLTYKSNRSPAGALVRPDTGPTKFNIDNQGRVTLSDNENQIFKVDRVDKKITISQKEVNIIELDEPATKMTTTIGTNQIVETKDAAVPKQELDIGTGAITRIEDGSVPSITEDIGSGAVTTTKDGSSELVTIVFQSGLSITCDGQNDLVEITTAGGAFAKIDGNSDEIVLNDNGIGGLKISTNKVALGTPAIELLEQINLKLTQLITLTTAMQAETHTGNLGYPTAPPNNAGDYAAVQAQLTTLQANINTIKGVL